MKIMEAIGKGFSLGGRNVSLLALLFVFNAAWNIATLPFVGQVQDLAALKVNPQLVILGIIFILMNIFVQGGLLAVLKDAVKGSGKASLGNFAKYGAKFYLRFLGLGLVIILILVLAALIVGLIFSISLAVKNVVINVISVSAAIILGLAALYYLFLLFLSPYTLVADDVGIFKAMGNSIKFVSGHKGKVVGLSTLLVLVGIGIGFIVGILAGILSLALQGKAFQIITGVISSGVNAYITIMISAALIAYYSALSVVQHKKEAGVSA